MRSPVTERINVLGVGVSAINMSRALGRNGWCPADVPRSISLSPRCAVLAKCTLVRRDLRGRTTQPLLF